jgi:hypothetical protein
MVSLGPGRCLAMESSGFPDPDIRATGRRDAVLVIMLGLWVRRHPMTSRIHLLSKPLFCLLLWPVIWLLMRMGKRPDTFDESTLIVGLSTTAVKPA